MNPVARTVVSCASTPITGAGWVNDFDGSFRLSECTRPRTPHEDGIARIKAETNPDVLRAILRQNHQLRGAMAGQMPLDRGALYYRTLDQLDAQDRAASERIQEMTK